MYPTYIVRPTTCAGRHAARRASSYSRNLSTPSFFPPALFGARHHPFVGQSPRGRQDVFDHFDDFVNRSFDGYLAPIFSQAQAGNEQVKTWNPRFDVREEVQVYRLRGELPGVEAHDLEVEFSNANTLVIRGKTSSEREEGQKPVENAQQDVNMTSSDANAKAPEVEINDAASESSYVQPTVEDEETSNRRESIGTETTANVAPNKNQDAAAKSPEQQQPQSRYWISERSTGTFSRTFEFPSRVDAENVSAALKNGILDVVVPKAKAPEAKKIQVN
ncbi:MAG: hypothetical protein Q9162_000735 [Coniocarpon cinnabarinum]